MPGHHHEQRSVAGMTIDQVIALMGDQHVPLGAVFDALPGDKPMIPGPDGEDQGMIIEPVLSWRVEDP